MKKMNAMQEAMLIKAREAREAAEAARKASADKADGDPKLLNASEEAAKKLDAAIALMKAADASVMDEAKKSAREALKKRRAADILKARMFTADNVTPYDRMVTVPSAWAVFSTERKPAKERKATAAALVKIDVSSTLSKEARKAYYKELDTIASAAIAYHYAEDGREAFNKANAAICEAYRLLGSEGVKPRYKGTLKNDVRNILTDVYRLNAHADSDVGRRSIVGEKVQACLCASLQAREERNAYEARKAEEERKAAAKEAAKDTKKKAPKDAPKKVVAPAKRPEVAAAK